MKPLVIFIVGPTASGKSDVALALARKIPSEIISCDSMQIYKGMEIITSQPPAPAMKLVAHHCIGVLSPSKEFNASLYRRMAVRAVRSIIKRKRTPIFAGGTGLYASAVIDGIFKGKAGDESVRRRLYALSRKRGGMYLHSRLERVDPEAAGKIHPNDLKRIVRALEVFETTGKTISELQKTRTGIAGEYNVRMFYLELSRADLNRKIDKRVCKMLARGALAEVKRLKEKKLGKTASMAIGIREIQRYLDGACGLDDAVEEMKKNTRRYAKRQVTWFRKDSRLIRIKVRQQDTAGALAKRIRDLLDIL